MSLLSVEEALDRVTGLFQPLDVETVPLREAGGRVLAREVTARLTQPPFPASAMDGYAVAGGVPDIGATFRVIGESAAGSGFSGRVGAGETVRIFTGAPVPEGADTVVIQENVRRDGDVITVTDRGEGDNIRPAGNDFSEGRPIPAPRRLSSADIALAAAMNLPELPVFRRPEIALVATGDELVMPGENPGPDQIIASNNFGLAALFEGLGATVRMLPIARDNPQSLKAVFEMCAGADLVVTIGGASVGDHDIVHVVATELGLETAFHKVAVRPGKPLMAGRLKGIPLVGLPGNPVSALVGAHLFLRPAVTVMQGFPPAPVPRERARLGVDVAANGPREHYMRARLSLEQGELTVHPFPRQDSALLSVLAEADALLVRPPHDPARKAGEIVSIVRI